MASNEEGGKQETAVVEWLKEYRRDRNATLLTLLLGGFIYLLWQFDVKEWQSRLTNWTPLPMKTYGEVDVRLEVPLNPTLDAEEKSAVRPDRFTPMIRSTRTVLVARKFSCSCLQYDCLWNVMAHAQKPISSFCETEESI